MDTKEYTETLLSAISYKDSQHILTGKILRELDNPNVTIETLEPFIKCLDPDTITANIQYIVLKSVEYNKTNVESNIWKYVPEICFQQSINMALNGAIKHGLLDLIKKFYTMGGCVSGDYIEALLLNLTIVNKDLIEYLFEKEYYWFHQKLNSKQFMRKININVKNLILNCCKPSKFHTNIY